MRIRRLAATLLCLTVCFSAPGSYALASKEAEVQNAGLAVKWLDFGDKYQAATLYEAAAESDLFAVKLHIDPNQDIAEYGFINGIGETVIPFDYDWATGFYEGIAAVRKDGNNYYVDKTGNTVLDLSAYDYVDGFYGSDFATVSMEDGRAGLIDRQGTLIIPCLYNAVHDYGDGYINVIDLNQKQALFDDKGSQLTDFTYDHIGTQGDNGYRTMQAGDGFGYLTRDGKLALPAVYEENNSFGDGLAPVKISGKWGYIDETGTVVIEPIYAYASSFENGVAQVYLSTDISAPTYIDKNGDKAEPKWISAPVENGLIPVSETVTGLYSADALKTDEGISFGPDDYILKDEIYTHSLTDADGNVVIGPKQYYLSYLGEGIYQGTHNDFEGTGITPPRNYTLTYALLDEQGKRFTTFSPAAAEEFRNGLATISGRYHPSWDCGVVNKQGAIVVPMVFTNLYLTDQGTCVVELSGYTDDGELYGKVGVLQLPADAATRANTDPKPIPVLLNGIELYFDSEPMITGGRTMIPMRKIFEIFGAEVNWDGDTQTVTSFSDNVSLSLTIGSDQAIINGETVALEAPAIIDSGRTFVPLRVAAEAFGAEVDWDETSGSVIINIIQ